jgi:two-component system, cell cycle response regulator
MRVLIAEDDAVSRMILRRAVQRFGHEVLVAEDGRKAWELYRETPGVDVVISDWMMPDIDGLELCHRLREEKRDEYTYFIFLTTLNGKEHLLEGMQAGADDYLSKPLDRDQLEVRLIAAARITALHRQLTKQKEELEKLNFELFK